MKTVQAPGPNRRISPSKAPCIRKMIDIIDKINKSIAAVPPLAAVRIHEVVTWTAI